LLMIHHCQSSTEVETGHPLPRPGHRRAQARTQSVNTRSSSCWSLAQKTTSVVQVRELAQTAQHFSRLAYPLHPGPVAAMWEAIMAIIEHPDPLPNGRQPLPRLVGHGCFACGTENPIGLKMRFYEDPGHVPEDPGRPDAPMGTPPAGTPVASDITLSAHFMGWEQIAHGGLVATLLDEVIAHAAILATRRYFVTRSMALDFLRPVPLEAPLTVRAWLTAPSTERGCTAAGQVRSAQGALLAAARAELRFVSPDRTHLLSPKLHADMERLFAAMEARRGGAR